MEFDNSIPYVDPANMKPPLNVKLITDIQGLEYGVKDFLSRQKIFGCDIETNIAKFYKRRIRLIQVGDRNEQYLIDLWEMAGRDTEYLRSIQGAHGVRMPKEGTFAKLREVLVPALDSNTHIKVGHNLVFDYMGLSWCLGMFMWNLWDTNLAEKCRYAGAVHFFEKNFWGLEDTTRRYLGVQISKEEQTMFWPDETGPLPLTQRQLNYGALDVRLPVRIREGQITYLTANKLMPTAEIENNAIPAFGDMHINGFFLDRDLWLVQVEETKKQHILNLQALDAEFIPLVGSKGNAPTLEQLAALETTYQSFGVDTPEEVELTQRVKDTKEKEVKTALRAERDQLKELRKARRAAARIAFGTASKLATWYRNEAHKMEGEAMINYSSPHQMKNALYKIKGLHEKSLKNTNDKTMKKIEKKFPIIKKVMDFRESDKLLGSYGEDFLLHINPDTGRIHAEFNQYGAETGRTSCEKPNLQQVPKGKKWRACFRARPGWKLVTRDLDGCELRIMAEASGDQIWIDAFLRKEDIHELTAMKIADRLDPGSWDAMAEPTCVFAVTKQKCECEKHSKKRSDAKIINFGVAYGKTVYGIMEELGCDEATAQAIYDAWHAENRVMSKYLKNSGENAKMTGEARTLIGRRRIFLKPSMKQAEIKLLADWKKKKWDKNEDGTARKPTGNQIMNKLIALLSAITREGSNTPIQGSNADLVKIAVGCGYDAAGVPFLWHHTRPDKDFAFLQNLVHDELVLEARDVDAEEADKLTDSALQRAGAIFVHSVAMTTDGKIKDFWAR